VSLFYAFGVGEDVMFSGCPSAASVRPDRSCYHDVSSYGSSNLDETYKQYSLVIVAVVVVERMFINVT